LELIKLFLGAKKAVFVKIFSKEILVLSTEGGTKKAGSGIKGVLEITSTYTKRIPFLRNK
jgi:hypothetical protein